MSQDRLIRRIWPSIFLGVLLTAGTAGALYASITHNSLFGVIFFSLGVCFGMGVTLLFACSPAVVIATQDSVSKRYLFGLTRRRFGRPVDCRIEASEEELVTWFLYVDYKATDGMGDFDYFYCSRRKERVEEAEGTALQWIGT